MTWWMILLLAAALFVAWAAYKRRNHAGESRGRLPDDGRHSSRRAYFGG